MSERRAGARRSGVSERPEGPRPAIVITGVLTAFLVLGGLAERLDYFGEARDTLQGQAGPAGLPNEGQVGIAVANALAHFGGVPFGPAAERLPSSVILTPEQLVGELPILSIVADDDYLNDPETGIMANMERTGPEWERLASVSLYEAGELVVGSRVGLRTHGEQASRFRGDPSFRLHFRPLYGATRQAGGRLLGPQAPPASVVVVRTVRYTGFYPNIFMFEIARRLGLPTVQFRPARVFLNGEARGIYLLTERVMPDGWGRTYFGDPDFYMFIYKGETKPRSIVAHDELTQWIESAAPLTMRRAAERIDVANLTRHLFALMFGFTTDWAQGAALLDRNDPGARWFWLHWDMDQSFDIRGTADLAPWEQPVMELITLDAPVDDLKTWGIVTDQRHIDRHMADIRRTAFRQLLQDPEYRRYFVKFVSDTLNHVLTPAYFDELLARYAFLLDRTGGTSRVDLGEYVRRRSGFVRREIARYFGLLEAVSVRLDGPPSVRYVIDGFDERGAYEGRYFPGQTVRLEIAAADGPALSHWLVDEERLDGANIEITVEHALRIRPVFKGR